MIEFCVNRTYIFTAFASLGIISLFLANVFASPQSLTLIKTKYYSLSKGDQYFGNLGLWQVFAQSGDWQTASSLEKKLDPSDLQFYKNQLDPTSLKKQLNTLIANPQKTVDDWLEITRINLILGKLPEAKQSITQAHNLDPIRDDITKLYYQLNKS